jgi:ribosomal protein S18 acetylase RimI-like enzyme
VQIRSARDSDAVALRGIVERAYSVYIDRIGRRPAPMDDDYGQKIGEGSISVAEEDGEVVGLIVLLVERDHLLIENVAVDPAHQGRGVGRALMAHAETYAGRRHISELRLYTNVAMTENLTLYSRLGYREDDRRTENGLRRVFFSKGLTASGAFETGPSDQPETAR